MARDSFPGCFLDAMGFSSRAIGAGEDHFRGLTGR